MSDAKLDRMLCALASGKWQHGLGLGLVSVLSCLLDSECSISRQRNIQQSSRWRETLESGKRQ